MSNNTLIHSPEWAALSGYQEKMETVHIKDMFALDKGRFDNFSLSLDGILYDYSKNHIDTRSLNLLMNLARARGVEEKRTAMIHGEKINASEGRSVLHMALRGAAEKTLRIDDESVSGFVDETLYRIKTISQKIHENKKITDIVNIGIGGSDLGPRMVCQALAPYSNRVNMHFISNIDGREIEEVLNPLTPENTLFIITSKTFTTLETLSNAGAAKDWLLSGLNEKELPEHLIAVTSASEKAVEFGVRTDHIFPMREWIGGRFSLWSAAGLSIALAYGFEIFEALLEGAYEADQHFIEAPLDQNIPVIMAMIGIWYRNFWNYPTYAVLPYAHDLSYLPSFLQQLDMESNGKSVDTDEQRVEYDTGPIVFGEPGTNAQHAFMQLLHQGTSIIPADFILVAKPQHKLRTHHIHLVSNALAQSKALMEGRKNTEEPHKNFEGNRPSSVFILDQLDAKRLGMLLAFYEHKIFVQGVIWGINSFDQWGVELGKAIARDLFGAITAEEEPHIDDGSTNGLINYFREKFMES